MGEDIKDALRNKFFWEICQRLQDAQVGKNVSMVLHNTMFTYLVREYLEELGYKYGVDFEYPEYDHYYIRKLNDIDIME